jgi:hypothetical protein
VVPTVWLERFVLGGVCVAIFVPLVVMNLSKYDWTQPITLGGAVVLFSLFVARTIERQQASKSTPPPVAARSPSAESPKAGAAEQSPDRMSEARPKAHAARRQASVPEPSSLRPLRPLDSLSDGQRFVLKQRLTEYRGSSIRLVLIGGAPQPEIVFEQLADVFKDADWQVQEARIGTVSVVGANFPPPPIPYLTGTDIASPTVKNVFSVFEAIGINLPLTPDAYMGPASMGTAPDVVTSLGGPTKT